MLSHLSTGAARTMPSATYPAQPGGLAVPATRDRIAFTPTGRTTTMTRRKADLFSMSLMCVFMTASMALSSLAVVTGELQQTFGLSDAQIGLLTSAFMASFAVAGLLSGLYASRWGGRLLAVTCGCFVIGSLTLGLCSSFEGLIIGRAIQGIGGGTVVSVCNPLITQTLPGARARRCLGIFGCGWGLGQVAALLLLPSVDRIGGFRAVFLTLAAVASVVGILALSQRAVRAIPRHTEAVASARAMATSLFAVAKNPRLLLLGLTSAAHLAVTVGILVWTPSFLEAHHDATLALAAYLTAGLGASQALGNLAGAAAAGRWGKHVVILASLAFMTVAAALVPVAPNPMVAFALVLVAGFCSFALFPPMIAYISQVVAKPEHVGPATGVHTVIGFAGSLVAPWIFGLVLDAGTRSSGSYLEGYLILASFGMAAVAGMSFFRPKRLKRETSLS